MAHEFKMGQYVRPGVFQWETNFKFSVHNTDRKLFIEDSASNKHEANLDETWVIMKIYKKSDDYYYFAILNAGTIGGNYSIKDYDSKDTPDYLPGTVNGVLKFIGSDDIRVLKQAINPNATFLQIQKNTEFQMKMATISVGGVDKHRVYLQF